MKKGDLTYLSLIITVLASIGISYVVMKFELRGIYQALYNHQQALVQHRAALEQIFKVGEKKNGIRK